jgi:chemotaxis methyl-accepting protein methylase/signal transduction histidine kinase/ActR/RegA family two-component response regulator
MVPVVGIGASAGGLEAFTQVLKHLPLDTGLAFVLVQHLDPKHESMLTEILSRETRMPVEEVQDGASVQPNRVYVIPPNTSMTIAGQVLRLKPREQISGPHMPIDQFLRSLAESCRNKAIGVILSGTGSDGALGLEAIKAEGGIIFAQDAESARFNSMPLRAVATGCVDFVLPPEQISGELARIGQHPYVMHPDAAPSGEGAEAGDETHKIFALLRAAKGVDFSLYKQTTITRRIKRRLALLKIATLEDYVKYLQDAPAELDALYHEMLIKVTGFFRDADAFDALQDKVIPQILKDRSPNTPIRVWVPGCASGEEAYSIAICLLEAVGKAGANVPIQIFASDISEPAIERARAGSYLENVAADISPARLERFFVRTDGGYQVSKPVRELCIFTRQDLISDPPFSKLDLISCRNVLIYMGPVQERIIPIFHYALKPDGFLMLGVSETTHGFPELFRAVDKNHKIFRRNEVARRIRFDYAAGGFPAGSRAPTKKSAPAHQGVWNSRELQKKVDLVLLSRYSPAGVVVNEDMEVLEIRGQVDPYLEFAPGKASLSLSKIARNTGLAVEIRAAIQEAVEKGEPVRKEGVQIERGGQFRDVSLEVVPLDLTGRRTLLVLFDESAHPSPPGPEQPAAGPEERAHRQILKLEQELTSTRKYMLELIEENEVNRDESQSVAEETLSSNEELQSINEELETAKEELQATNEEMVSVNDELQNRNTDLQQSRDFALSIVDTIRHPLLVLGMNRRVMSANRSFYGVFHTSAAETEGRSLFELGDGHFDTPELRTRLDKVLHDEDSFENFEFEGDFAKIGRKVILFSANRLTALQMVLLTMEDITERKAMETALRGSEEQLRQSQKMEAVGRLAGGIAHDFNNLLTVVMGHSDMLLSGVPGEAPDQESLEAIRGATERGASLTQQLLAFSRRQVLQPKVLDLGDLIAEYERMLRRLIGEHIELIVNCSPELWRVKADPGQLGRVVMNLALNARDAMPQGGTLTMELGNVHLDEAGAAELQLTPGRYAMLAVSDTGTGMDAETLDHLFEPFFTTKGRGVGTGLGLPVVFGIVEQSGGAIRCHSEVGRGATFRIYLPRVEESVKSGAGPGAALSEAPSGSEVVLLVEDEDGVRSLARRILERSGYTVIEARHGKEGLSVCESHAGPIQLLVTDVLMPGIGGRELAERSLLLRPEMKVLFMSGHTDDAVLDLGIKLHGTPFLQKPFTLVQLAKKVREVLDGPREASRPR